MKIAPPKVCVVVLNLFDLAVLKSCLTSLETCGYPAQEIIVVRNGPFDEALERGARSVSPGLKSIMFNGSNLGFAAGNAPGIRAALAGGADYVLLFNDDAEAGPGSIGRLVDLLESRPEAGMAGPRIFYSGDPSRIWFSGAVLDRSRASFSFPGSGMTEQEYPGGGVSSTDYVTGCALLASRAFLEKVGLMDERYFLYWEDADWGLRALEAGFSPLTDASARVYHKVSFSTGGDESPLKRYHKTRGQFYFAVAHAGGALPRLFFAAARDIAWLLLKCRKPGRFRLALAHAAAVADYLMRRTGRGPEWLWKKAGR